jgi:hypothetical protein
MTNSEAQMTGDDQIPNDKLGRNSGAELLTVYGIL